MMDGVILLHKSRLVEKTMLIKIIDYQNLDTRKLMDVYSESNYENTDYFILTKQIKMQPSERLKRAFWIF